MFGTVIIWPSKCTGYRARLKPQLFVYNRESEIPPPRDLCKLLTFDIKNRQLSTYNGSDCHPTFQTLYMIVVDELNLFDKSHQAWHER